MCGEKQVIRYHGQAADYLRKPDPVKRLMKDAGKMKQEMEDIRAKRADLFRMIGECPDYSDGDAFAEYAERVFGLDLPKSDRAAMERYICYGELLHLLEKALITRIGGRNEKILLDCFFGKISL